jgi:hypothetical protein
MFVPAVSILHSGLWNQAGRASPSFSGAGRNLAGQSGDAADGRGHSRGAGGR